MPGCRDAGMPRCRDALMLPEGGEGAFQSPKGGLPVEDRHPLFSQSCTFRPEKTVQRSLTAKKSKDHILHIKKDKKDKKLKNKIR